MSRAVPEDPSPEDLAEMLEIAEDDDLRDLRPDPSDSRAVADAKKRRRTVLLARKIGIALAGGMVLAAGIVMIPLPGPGWLVVVFGLWILSFEFRWAERLFDQIHDKVVDAAHLAASNKWGTMLSIVSACGIIAAGFVWALWEDLPFSSWYSGLALSASGVVALFTIWWAASDLKKKRARLAANSG
ncbi:PGPGW domain-containing protein [Sporichthya polymorpha]|uniref:PGPGW domain-containing protein n=1 Tax=Sporichthya polymorpha TaxID=35751 RepID=UPI0003739FE1|nr:PGPGW domain-containing protein [Sporichthya polymorpha]